jgi:choline dehydrogenase-like flavoprotein/predicted acylesterase/phospholipase RssA
VAAVTWRALALSGGGARGEFHLGVVRAALDVGLSFDFYTGLGVGSVNATLLAQYDHLADAVPTLEAIWDGLRRNRHVLKAPFGGALVGLLGALISTRGWARDSVYSIKPLEDLIRKHLDWARLEGRDNWAVPFTSLTDGDDHIATNSVALDRFLRRGLHDLRTLTSLDPASDAYVGRSFHDLVRAAAAVPFVMPPTDFLGHRLGEAGLREFVPLRPAMAAALALAPPDEPVEIVAVVVTPRRLPLLPRALLDSGGEIANRSIDVMAQELLENDFLEVESLKAERPGETRVVEIYPDEAFPRGTLDFSALDERREFRSQGYAIGMRVLSQLAAGRLPELPRGIRRARAGTRPPAPVPQGLGEARKQAVHALMPPVLGLERARELARVEAAVDRLDGFLRSLPREAPRQRIRQLVDVVIGVSMWKYLAPPWRLSKPDLADLVRRFFDPDLEWRNNIIDGARQLCGLEVPSVRDMGRALREMLCLSYYSQPDAERDVGYLPVYERPAILAVVPELPADTRYTTPDRVRLDVGAIRARHIEASDAPVDRLFRNDGRPRVAIIGSGCGGAAVAAQLADRCDVAVFEAGPRVSPPDTPLDAMAAMALMFDDGLMTPTRNLDMRVMRARVVGGGSTINAGVAVRPRAGTLEQWKNDAGLDRAAFEKALDHVAVVQRFGEYARDLMPDWTHTFERGARAAGLDTALLLSDIATRVEQQDPDDPWRRGERCLGCGLCNYGCHFGHHRTVELTFLRQAEAAGALVHPNMGVRSIVTSFDLRTRKVRARGLRLERDPDGAMVPVDHVVVAAGAVGSPALLLRSAEEGPLAATVPAMSGRFGAGIGFNYGMIVVGRWKEEAARPAHLGIHIGMVAARPGDTRSILESGFLPPGVLSAALPGIGRLHRDWIKAYRRLGMAVNTIGSPQSGRVNRNGEVEYAFTQGEISVIHETLFDLINLYLHAGAERVAVAGNRGESDPLAAFTPDYKDDPARVRRLLVMNAPTAEHLALSSGHPQGGLRMSDDPEAGVVDGRYRVHGTANLFVADASVFPSTITVNPQWAVMAAGVHAGACIRELIERE